MGVAMARRRGATHNMCVAPTHHSIDRQAILVVHESMARVNNCPLPYPFLCILHISTFLFIYR